MSRGRGLRCLYLSAPARGQLMSFSGFRPGAVGWS